MATKGKSRWADDEDDAALEAQRRKEKDEKKRAKAEKQRKIDEADQLRQADTVRINASSAKSNEIQQESSLRPSKRRKISPEIDTAEDVPAKLLRFPAAEWGPCRHVDNFEKLNHIEEGSYGWVSRARESATGEIVALKKLKMDYSNDGFPVTGLREIQTLKDSRHDNIVYLREVVMGNGMSEYFPHLPSLIK